MKKRPVTDADVVFRGDPRSQLPYALSAAGLSPRVSYIAQDANAPTSFNFAPGIRVDVMPEVADRWGSLKSAVKIEGIPVLSLKMLAQSKRLAALCAAVAPNASLSDNCPSVLRECQASLGQKAGAGLAGFTCRFVDGT